MKLRHGRSAEFRKRITAGLLTVIYLSVNRDTWGDAALTYLAELSSAVQERRLPDLPADSDLRTAVLFLRATGLTFLIAPHLIRLLCTTIWLLMLIPDQFVASSATAVRRAELAARARISTGAELVSVTRTLVRQSRRILAPRLVVLRTDSTVWQDAVRHLAAISQVTLVDVSEPTENLLWELKELTAGFGSRWLLVGRYDQVRHLADDPENVFHPGSVVARWVDLLDGHEILAYTTDRHGQRCFARALRVRFTALPGQ